MKMIKILMIAKAMEKTGVTSVMMSYYRGLNPNSFKIDFATGSIFEEEYEQEIVDNGGHFFVIPNRDKNLIEYVKTLSKIIRTEKYDIVHVHGNSTMIFPELVAAWMGGAKVRIAHSHNTMCNHPHLEPISRPLFNAFYTDALACSEEAGKWMFGNKPFTVINNGIDTLKFAFNEKKRNIERAKIGVHDELLVGHVGYFNYQKNHDKLVDVFEAVHRYNKKTKLLLVGDGSEKVRIQEKVRGKDLENEVIFYGLSNQVETLMSAIDVFVLPSRFEGLPVVAIEAQASGIPCILSKTISDEVDLTSTICFHDISEADDNWAKSIIDVLQENSRNEQSEKNIERIKEKKYDSKTVIFELEKKYRAFLKKANT